MKGARNHLIAFAPPGAAKLIAAEFDKLDGLVIAPDPPAIVRGAARIQLSTLTLSLSAGSTSEVTVHAWIRAHYTADAGTTDLPRPIHGDVKATFEVRLGPVRNGRQQLVIQPSADDSKIAFLPTSGTGLSTADIAAISAQVRKAVREGFATLPVDLPLDLPFNQFKALGNGPGQALALPIKLSGTGPPERKRPGLDQPVHRLQRICIRRQQGTRREFAAKFPSFAHDGPQLQGPRRYHHHLLHHQPAAMGVRENHHLRQGRVSQSRSQSVDQFQPGADVDTRSGNAAGCAERGRRARGRTSRSSFRIPRR